MKAHVGRDISFETLGTESEDEALETLLPILDSVSPLVKCFKCL
jgi:hypothetical protein